MNYLLDTCAISETTKPRPARAFVEWLRQRDPESLFVSVLTIGELEKGIERLPGTTKRNQLRTWFEKLRFELHDRILPVNETIAVEWGRLLANSERRGRSLPVVDALLGATAIVHGLTLVTRNTSDIERAGARIFDPWS